MIGRQQELVLRPGPEPPEPFCLEDHVAALPFCGGVVAWQRGRMVFTLAKTKDWRLTSTGRRVVPIAWVGGGQEPGETVRQCAAREATEELGCAVELFSAGRTHWFRDQRRVPGWPLLDEVRPLLVERRTSDGQPYKPGHPAGPEVWVAVYECALAGAPSAADVPGILSVGREQVTAIEQGISLDEAHRCGMVIELRDELPGGSLLRLRAGGPETLLAGLWLDGLIGAGS
jgi:hypothetical protein